MEDENVFECTGKVNINDFHLPRTSLLIRGQLDTLWEPEISQNFELSTLKLFGTIQPASTGILHLKHFLKLMEMQMRILSRFKNPEVSLKKAQNIDFYQLRKEIIIFLNFIKNYFQSIRGDWPFLQHALTTDLKAGFDEVLSSVRRFLSQFSNIPSIASNIGNRCVQPEFHLFHLHLELRWLIIVLVHDSTLPWLDHVDQNDRLDRTIQLVIQDLMMNSLKIFERITSTDLKQITPWSCSCVRDLWLLIQFVIEKSKKLNNNFWNYVNSVINSMIKPSESAKQLSWIMEKNTCRIITKSPEIFSLWIIYHLTILQGYHQDGSYSGSSSGRIESNSSQLEKLLKSFLEKGGKVGERDEIDEELRAMIPLLKTLILDYWRSRESSINIISSLWECFHRRLDQPFLVQTSGPWSISLEKKEPQDIYKQIKGRIFEIVDNPKESSFGMFLRLLGIILKNSYDKKDIKIWNQIRGRIYSKFSKSKVKEFTEVRLYNLITLFLTLGVTADAANVCKIVIDLLPNPLEIDCDSNRRISLSWKGQLCCLLLLSDKNHNFELISDKLTTVVDVLSCRRDETGRLMMSTFVQTLNTVLSSSSDLERGEYHLIGGWIDRYLLECPKSRAGTMLKMLLSMLEKARDIDMNKSTGKPMLEAIWSSAAGRIRALVYDNDLTDDNCEDIGKLAAALTLEALRCPRIAESQKHSAMSLFRHFTNTIYVKDVKISKLYLSIILENRSAVVDLKKILDNFDLLVIQVWIKCSIFGQDSNTGEMKTIKNYVLNLEEIEKVFPSWKDSLEFKNSRESLILYVNALAARRSSISEAERIILDKRTRVVFSTLDKWVLNPIKEDNTESAFSFNIYKCLGTIILTCAPIFHTNNSSSMLRILITRIMLPSDENGHLRHLGKKIFSMIMLGLEKLSFKNDLIIKKIIIELFNVYLPILIVEGDNRNFKVAEQMIKFFKECEKEFVGFVLDKLSENFITILNNEMNKFSYLAMELLKNLLSYGEASRKFLVDLLVTKCLPSVIECYVKVHDLHPHKRQTIELIIRLSGNFYYQQDQELKELMMNTVSKIITMRVRDYPKGCFEFLREIFKIDKSVTIRVIENIELLVNELEINRRPNAGSLRYSLRQLREFCDKIEP